MNVLSDLMTVDVLVPWILSMLLGIFVGATPGLTATMAVALIVPLCFRMEPNAGLAMIIGVSFTAIFAGDIPATWLRIPGTPASAAATLDSHELAKQGRGNDALILDLCCSAIGGVIGVVLLMVLAPQLARLALMFSHYEYFWLGVLGLSMSAMVTTGQTGRALFAGAFGMFISTVGQDVTTFSERYTFGHLDAMEGLDFIPVMIGLFGVAEVMRNLWTNETAALSDSGDENGLIQSPDTKRASFFRVFPELIRHWATVLKSAVVGTVIGALPGAGADVAAWGAYGLAKSSSKQPEEFGKGAIEGVVAPTSANNAAVAGAWIPALVFGVPGDAVTAIVLGVLIVMGIKPGPFLFEDGGTQVHSIFAIALLTQVFLVPCGWAGIRVFDWIQQLPRSIILIAVLVFSVVGAYAIKNSMFDVYVMIAFGLIGYIMEKCLVPVVPLILGLILGPMVEENYRTGLISSSGSFVPFFSRPICLILMTVLLLMFAGRPVAQWLRKPRLN